VFRIFRHPALLNWSVLFGGTILVILVVISIAAPYLTSFDPHHLSPRDRLQAPSGMFILGSDMYGRDVMSRIFYGGRVSLLVSATVAVGALSLGLVAGLLAGYFQTLDGLIMRIMDGVMAIPGILLAIAFVTISGATLVTVIIAILIPEIPRVARLVRSVVLSIREEPYVEAARGLGTSSSRILLVHIFPNTVAPLLVQGTYICASAMLTEATLSFIGAGLPMEIPTWGNIISEGRTVFQRAPWIILCPGAFLAAAILAINILGDGLRDTLDPRLTKRVGN